MSNARSDQCPYALAAPRLMAGLAYPLIFALIAATLPCESLVAQETNELDERPREYLIPGHGSDRRIFSKWVVDGFSVHQVPLATPERNETLAEYSRRLSDHIETDRPYVLVGVSFGGMNAVEMMEHLDPEPERVIIISSAKCRNELPIRYRILRFIPIYRLVPARLYIPLGHFAREVFESDYRLEKQLFKSMLQDKDPVFVKRVIRLIVNWDRDECLEHLVHTTRYQQDRTVAPGLGG